MILPFRNSKQHDSEHFGQKLKLPGKGISDLMQVTKHGNNLQFVPSIPSSSGTGWSLMFEKPHLKALAPPPQGQVFGLPGLPIKVMNEPSLGAASSCDPRPWLARSLPVQRISRASWPLGPGSATSWRGQATVPMVFP